MQLRVMLVDRCALVRSGFRRILEDEPDMAVVAEVANGRDAVRVVSRRDIDVVVVGTTVARRPTPTEVIDLLRARPNTKVVCLRHWAGLQEVKDALSAGVVGCIDLYRASEMDLKRAIRVVGRGERYLSSGLSDSAASQASSDDRSLEHRYELLTLREKQVSELVARSRSNREIAVGTQLEPEHHGRSSDQHHEEDRCT